MYIVVESFSNTNTIKNDKNCINYLKKKLILFICRNRIILFDLFRSNTLSLQDQRSYQRVCHWPHWIPILFIGHVNFGMENWESILFHNYSDLRFIRVTSSHTLYSKSSMRSVFLRFFPSFVNFLTSMIDSPRSHQDITYFHVTAKLFSSITLDRQ